DHHHEGRVIYRRDRRAVPGADDEDTLLRAARGTHHDDSAQLLAGTTVPHLVVPAGPAPVDEGPGPARGESRGGAFPRWNDQGVPRGGIAESGDEQRVVERVR